MTDRQPGGSEGGSEGLRIAATRAGQHNKDDPEYELEDRIGAGISDDLGDDWGSPTLVTEFSPARIATPPGTATAVTKNKRPRPPATASERRRVQQQRRRRRRRLISLIVAVAIGTIGAGLADVYLQNRLNQIKRVRLTSLTPESGSTTNILLVSTDTGAQPDGSDAIVILHVDRRARTAAIVSVPRELYVPIAGTKGADRVINSFVTAGPDRLVATLQGILGVRINHYLEINFAALKVVIDAVDGVALYLPNPVRDTVTGFAFDKAGCLNLDGREGLTWLRSRQVESLVDGMWQPDSRGDVGRLERQQDLLRRVIRTVLAVGVGRPLQLNRLLGAAAGRVTFDQTLSSRDLAVLGDQFDSLDPTRVALGTLPSKVADVGGAPVRLLELTQAQPVIDVLNGKASALPPPTTAAGSGATTTTTAGAKADDPKAADVKVRVLNGVGTPGAASKAATSLTTLGFAIADKGDAPGIAPKTTILYGSGQLAKAQLVQGSLLTQAVLKEDATLMAVDVNLILGGDYTGVKSSISSGTSATTSTAPTTTAARTSSSSPPTGAAPC